MSFKIYLRLYFQELNQVSNLHYLGLKENGNILYIRGLKTGTFWNISVLSINGCKALDVFLKLKPRKYKYKAYITIPAAVLSHSTMTIERRGTSAAIALSL
jgi:hypothetical protein